MSEKKARPAGGKDLEAFRAAHDKNYIVPARIKKGLSELGESWEYEADFIRRCGLSQTDFAAYRDQFDEFFVDTDGSHRNRGKRVWAGTKPFAAKLREVL
jgi:hypothetical protein